ncbi:glycogen debranching enzyme [Lophiostoma macrostomum CBS 122681]|uniref:Glycogen debranching enzyme n=1 Tax=Lophiostoma macrostomum CBS 122681 TaxID=1314788 RepID=A0A6A6TBL6_9PLEO|nr:glycogen debranching enzyme [Lophiostoma macrostomum CBS 122681]
MMYLGGLVQLILSALLGAAAADTACSNAPSRLHLSDPPYDNYLYSDCHSSTHVVVTSPLKTSNLKVIGPRLLIAWPSGNSGAAAIFVPEDGSTGTLAIKLDKSETGNEIEGIYVQDPLEYGVFGWVNFNSSARLTIPILGSIRTIRDYTEGGNVLEPTIQDGIVTTQGPNGSASYCRTWFDHTTTTCLMFAPTNGAAPIRINKGPKWTMTFGAGTYLFNAVFNYPQMKQLLPAEVLNSASRSLIQSNEDQTTSLSFLSYSDKLLAGTWRFLTYFGRDSMITLLLMQPVLSEGKGGAIEAVIGAALERVNNTDGSACHEEVIGDYATFTHKQAGIASNDPLCDYKMVDTDYFLPIVLKNYLVDTATGKSRTSDFLSTKATFLKENNGLTYKTLAEMTTNKILAATAPFAKDGGQKKENLIKLKTGQPVGQWRDSANGLGGGRIPYDVNTALVPAALRAIAQLSKSGLFPDHAWWGTFAEAYASVWEDKTLSFFEVTVEKSKAISDVQSYVSQSKFSGPSNTGNIAADVTFHGLALNDSNNQAIVRVMNTDDCFRHFLLNTTDQKQLSSFLDQTAEHILQPFPVGLSTDVGLFVANPAYGENDAYISDFTNSGYHGTVVWGWQLAMMAAGLSRQLGRCSGANMPGKISRPQIILSVYAAS